MQLSIGRRRIYNSPCNSISFCQTDDVVLKSPGCLLILAFIEQKIFKSILRLAQQQPPSTATSHLDDVSSLSANVDVQDISVFRNARWSGTDGKSEGSERKVIIWLEVFVISYFDSDLKP